MILKHKKYVFARGWELTPVILVTWENEIKRMEVPGCPGQIV
jgi:hypothetical protein